MVSYNPIYSDLHLLKGFNCGMIELLQGFSMAKGLVFGHSQKKRDKPINPKPVLIDNNADILYYSQPHFWLELTPLFVPVMISVDAGETSL